MKINLTTAIVISGLKVQDIRFLSRYNLLPRKNPPARYNLAELIYCRIFFHLIVYYGREKAKAMLYPYSNYGNNLVSKNFGVIEFTKSVIIEMQLTDELESELALEQLTNNWSIFSERTTIPDKFQGEIDLDKCYLNLEIIKTEVDPPPLAA